MISTERAKQKTLKRWPWARLMQRAAGPFAGLYVVDRGVGFINRIIEVGRTPKEAWNNAALAALRGEKP